jgi:hypothetical protein
VQKRKGVEDIVERESCAKGVEDIVQKRKEGVEDIVERESCGKGVEDIVQKRKGVEDIGEGELWEGCGGYYAEEEGCGGYWRGRVVGRVWRILCRRGRVWKLLWRESCGGYCGEGEFWEGCGGYCGEGKKVGGRIWIALRTSMIVGIRRILRWCRAILRILS